MLDGFFTGFGYLVQSERESGYGRSDLIIPDPARGRCMILELKHVRQENEMAAAADEAVSQILQKKYASTPRYAGVDLCLQYGMAFWGKRCIIRRTNDID